MLIPLQWLSEFITLDQSAEDLAHLLTMSGLEVESIGSSLTLPPEVVTARILSREAHPKADKLSLCQVSFGADPIQVVCGAPNARAGDTVVLALPGAKLPSGMTIAQAVVRGQSSSGMLCSARELGISEDQSGLLVLDPETPLGVPLTQVWKGADKVLELKVTANRGDCLSMLGVARELSALLRRPLLKAAPAPVPFTPGPVPARLTVEDAQGCPVYLGRVVRGVKVGPSPRWLVERLQAVGLRSINNIVDATNYILMERGQPLHAFDLDKLAGAHIIVRRALAGETILALDGVVRSLEPRDLAICDESGPVAIAGVMGGSPTAVSEQTTSLFLEAACFSTDTVRGTARRTELHSDSSHRFERGVDPGGVRAGLDAVTALILQLAGGEVVGEPLSAVAWSGSRPAIELSPARVNALLGLCVPGERMATHLEAFQMKVSGGPDLYQVIPPSWRYDMEREADLAEEIAHLEGYANLPTTLPRAQLTSPSPGLWRRPIRDLVTFLTGRGLDQVYNYTFVSPDLMATLGLKPEDPRGHGMRLLNPISEDRAIMRTTLLPSLLRTAIHNVRREGADLQIFEVGKVFMPVEGQVTPEESQHVGILLSGAREPLSWTSAKATVDIFDLKGILEDLFQSLRIEELSLELTTTEAFLTPGQAWQVSAKGVRLGYMGLLHPEVARKLDLEAPIYVCELNFQALYALRAGLGNLRPLPRFPAVTRDVAMLLKDSVPAGELMALIRRVGGSLLERVILFDVYRGKGIPEGMKSVACGLQYRAENRTLVEAEVLAAHAPIVAALEQELGAQLRS